MDIPRLLLAWSALLLIGAAPAPDAKRIAFTFDDVPRAPGGFLTPNERSRKLIESLRRGGVRQAGFFVTTSHLEAPYGAGGEARIAAYVAAGHVIGNHSHGHGWLSRMSAGDFIADLDRAEAWLAGRRGRRPWFRFPYLDEGGHDVSRRQAVREALAERGLRNAYVTIDNYDWFLDSLATLAREDKRRLDMEALRDLYVETLVSAANFYDGLARETIGRSPAHVLLLHETDLAALFVDDLADALKADGWTIIGIEEAYRDPIASDEPDGWFLGEGRVAALAQLAGRVPRDLIHERSDEAVLSRLFAERVLQEEAESR